MSTPVPCDRCAQPVGLVSFMVQVYVHDDLVGEVTICSACGAFIGGAQIRTTPELER